MWPSSWHAIEWTLTSRIIIILIFLAFWSYKITFPFGGICRGSWHGPWRQCLIVYTLHTPTLFFSEPSTVLLLKILKFPFLDIYLEPDNSNLEVWKDHINSTQQWLTPYLYNFYVCLAILLLITIFGNAHRPCKQYPNIVDNS